VIAADIERFAASAPLAAGYRFELLMRPEIQPLIDGLSTWYRDISIGGASCYMQEQHYREKVFFPDVPQRQCIVLTLKRGAELTGVFTCTLDDATQSIYGGLGVAAPGHRGSNLAYAGMTFIETVARHLGMGFIFGMVTLKHPHAQEACERAGWQIIGIAPGYDRELIAPGVVKRVYEAIYAKVLEPESGLLRPEPHNLTPRTRALFDSLFRPLQA
jgi:hypothetical protein